MMKDQVQYQPTDFLVQLGGQTYVVSAAELMIGVGVFLIVGLMFLWWKSR